ncbi:MAG: DUF6384 family protein [bacterium]|nr:DUF6384 family protein [bacterium]
MTRLNLDQIKRILDVAESARDDRDPIARELDHERTRLRMRDRLIAASEVQGEPLSETEASDAIDAYFQSLYEFQEPSGFQAAVARLYVRFMSIGDNRS